MLVSSLRKQFLPCLAAAALLSIASSRPAAAVTIASCNTTVTVCSIPENTFLYLPFVTIAGDVVLTEPGSTTVSDVFRIFNNFVNTGSGTGLGYLAFLYSSDDLALPPPFTYSANAVFVPESSAGITSYTNNGTTYLLGVPEPQTWQLLASAMTALLFLHRKRARSNRGGF